MRTLEGGAAVAMPLTDGARELWCGGCGYGVVVRRDPPECPMCRGSAWRERPPAGRWN